MAMVLPVAVSMAVATTMAMIRTVDVATAATFYST